MICGFSHHRKLESPESAMVPLETSVNVSDLHASLTESPELSNHESLSGSLGNEQSTKTLIEIVPQVTRAQMDVFKPNLKYVLSAVALKSRLQHLLKQLLRTWDGKG